MASASSFSCSRLFQRSTKAYMSLSRKIKSSPSVVSSNGSCRLPHRNPASRPHPPFFTRLPVELAGGASLMPFHTATALSLLRSMLSSKVGQWGTLSEGFATPL